MSILMICHYPFIYFCQFYGADQFVHVIRRELNYLLDRNKYFEYPELQQTAKPQERAHDF